MLSIVNTFFGDVTQYKRGAGIGLGEQWELSAEDLECPKEHDASVDRWFIVSNHDERDVERRLVLSCNIRLIIVITNAAILH